MPNSTNSPPLADQLALESEDLTARAEALVAAAARAAVTDDESAGKVTLLGKQIAEWITKCEKARVARKAPFLESERIIDAHFKVLTEPLEKAKKAAGALLKAWGDKLRQQQEEDRRQAAQAARVAQEEADRQVALAALADEPGADEQAAAASEKAVDLAEKATAPVHVQVDSGQGAKATFSTVKTVKISNLAAAVYHLIQVDREAVSEFTQKQMEKLARGNKLVPADDGKMGLPGCEIGEDTTTRFR